MASRVIAVSQRGTHSFSKQPRMWIRLMEGLGVEGDAHLGITVQHRSRLARDPTQPNLRTGPFAAPGTFSGTGRQKAFVIGAGDIGENILNLRC